MWGGGLGFGFSVEGLGVGSGALGFVGQASSSGFGGVGVQEYPLDPNPKLSGLRLNDVLRLH